MLKYNAYLLLGSNIGNRQENLEKTRSALKALGKIIDQSSLYETEPWGLEDQPYFLNQAILIETTLQPVSLLEKLKAMEKMIGRQKSGKWHPREIDIDILAMEGFALETDELTLPHPQLHRRNFALIPLMEIAPEWVHPDFDKTVEELYDSSTDRKEVSIFSGE